MFIAELSSECLGEQSASAVNRLIRLRLMVQMSLRPARVRFVQSLKSRSFEFLYGHWKVHNRKLRDVADPSCEDWVEFDASSEVFPILGGIGHVDRIYVPSPSDGEPFEGFTLRLYEPSTETWRIWWSSTRAPGRLDPPVGGRFVGEEGTFECDDVIDGRHVKVRFEWRANDVAPSWRQFFSYDEGASWTLNWEMNLTRSDQPHVEH